MKRVLSTTAYQGTLAHSTLHYIATVAADANNSLFTCGRYSQLRAQDQMKQGETDAIANHSASINLDGKSKPMVYPSLALQPQSDPHVQRTSLARVTE